ncbi:hypothetical protein RHMOL_Rhmol04G0365700 [Rhododendron molle]|uniref:Uncharacterized protein n=1 Tax=Rhododendron molle TaxID=49168 RepID=A0ACC0P8J8_RHOML|nr:hypothetical protein RHMOL_Rhmol04G0365700 [Rhododendron molle]
MDVITYDMEVPCSIAPARVFKAFVLDADTLIPKIMPHAMKSSAYKTLKHRVDAIDKENFTYSFSVIDGAELMDKFESISYHTKIVPGPDGGSIYKIRSIYQTKGSPYKSAKQRVDAVDKENFAYSYTVIEGSAFAGLLESISYHIKIVAAPEGGSICKYRGIYTTKGDAQVSEEEIKAGKERGSGMFKAIEAYLLANPDA